MVVGVEEISFIAFITFILFYVEFLAFLWYFLALMVGVKMEPTRTLGAVVVDEFPAVRIREVFMIVDDALMMIIQCVAIVALLASLLIHSEILTI